MTANKRFPPGDLGCTLPPSNDKKLKTSSTQLEWNLLCVDDLIVPFMPTRIASFQRIGVSLNEPNRPHGMCVNAHTFEEMGINEWNTKREFNDKIVLLLAFLLMKM